MARRKKSRGLGMDDVLHHWEFKSHLKAAGQELNAAKAATSCRVQLKHLRRAAEHYGIAQGHTGSIHSEPEKFKRSVQRFGKVLIAAFDRAASCGS